MAESYTLEAQQRTIVGKKVSQLRNQGLVPVVVYGSKTEPIHLQVPYRALQVALMKAGGTHLIDIAYGSNSVSVLARDVQRDVLRGDILHVDFLAVDVNQVVSTDIPVHFIGESPAVESRIGTLQHGINTVTVEALPRDLISALEVDISNLREVGDSVFVRDINLGGKVTILTPEDELLVRIAPVHVAAAEEEEEEELAGPSEPELVRRERDEEDEDEG